MPLLWLSLAFICGIVCAAVWQISSLSWVCFAATGLFFQLLAWIIHRRQQVFTQISSLICCRLPARQLKFFSSIHIPVPWLILMVCFACGGWRYRSAEPGSAQEFIGWWNNRYREVVVEGILIKPPDQFDTYQRLRLQVKQIRAAAEVNFSDVSGNILIYVARNGEWRYGDLIRVQGALNTPPSDNEFSYEAYLHRQGVYSLMPYAEATLISRNHGSPIMAAIYAFKSRALMVIFRIFPDPEASLLAGILLGVESSIPEDVYQAFRQTGTAHIIVISGFNITILAGLFSIIFGKLLGRWRGALVSTLVITLYTILVGAEAAVVRAALMGGLSLYACQLGRRQTGINTLAFVAAIMTLFSPYVLWDVGFQLSFAATLGLVLYADPFTGLITRHLMRILPQPWVERVAGWIGEYFLFTIAAQLMTLPIMMYYFHNLSLISLLANPVILPAQPLVMTLGGIALCLGLVWQPLGHLAGNIAWPFAAYTIRCVEGLAEIRAGWLPINNISSWVIWLYYGVLLFISFKAGYIEKFKKILKPGVVLLSLWLITILVWQTIFTGGDGKLHLTFLDVNQGSISGEALLIKTPGGRTILVNGGPDSRALSQALGRRMPVIRPELDWLLVAGGSDEQLDALSHSIQRHPPHAVLWAGDVNFSSASRRVSRTITQMGVNIMCAEAGQILDLGEGAKIHVLAVSSHGGVFLITWRKFRALLPIGLDLSTVRWLNMSYQAYPVDVLLLANNGHNLFNPALLIKKLNPRLVILSVAAGDKNGLPSGHTLETIQQYPLLRTDQNGWIHITTDGEQMWVEADRQ